MILDIIFSIILVLAFFSGYKKGIIFMAAFLVGICLGVFASLQFSVVITHFLNQNFNISQTWLPFISLVLSFSIIFLVVKYLSEGLKKLLETIHLNSLNKVLGGAIGAAIAFGLISVGFWHLTEAGIITQNAYQDSRFYGICMQFAPNFIEIGSKILPFFNKLLDSVTNTFQQVSDNQTQQ